MEHIIANSVKIYFKNIVVNLFFSAISSKFIVSLSPG